MPGEHQTFRPSRPLPTFAIFEKETTNISFDLVHIDYYNSKTRGKRKIVQLF